MSHLVISQTWLKAGDEHLAGYLELVERFDAFLRAQPGFISRRLVRSLENPRHLVHLREFDDVGAYEAMTAIPEYREQIRLLSEHVDADAYPEGAVPREYAEVIFDSTGR